MVNSNIERLLQEVSGVKVDLYRMESEVAGLLDFKLFVSLEEYNREACQLNVLIHKQRAEDLQLAR